jgi:hypothetical protein
MKFTTKVRLGKWITATASSLLVISVMLLSGYALAADISDNFNDNLKNNDIWGKDEISGGGVLKEINQRLQYTVSASTVKDAYKRLLVARGPYNSSWQTQIDLFNSTNPTQILQLNSFGIDIYHCSDPNDWVYAEMYASSYDGFAGIKGFHAEFATDDGVPAWTDSGDLAGVGTLAGAVQITFDSLTKIISVYYSYNGGGWAPFGSFGVSAVGGGADGNGDWLMTDSDQFCLRVYGYSENMEVTGGKMYGDNFLATGAAAPLTTRILQPNGGETVPAGELYHVAWEAPAEATKFKLKYSVDNGTTWNVAAPNVLTGTSYDWPVPVPSINKNLCLVKVTGYDDNNAKVGSDKSDGPFTIEVLTITAPATAEIVPQNIPYTITWTANGTAATPDQVIVKYTLNNGATWKTAQGTLGASSFSWNVPAVPKPKNNAMVKVILKAAGVTVAKAVSNKFTVR